MNPVNDIVLALTPYFKAFFLLISLNLLMKGLACNLASSYVIKPPNSAVLMFDNSSIILMYLIYYTYTTMSRGIL